MSRAGAQRALRILYIVESAATGVGRHVLDLLDAARAAGHMAELVYSPVREDAVFRAGRAKRAWLRAMAVPMRRAPGPADLRPLWTLRHLMSQNGPYDILHGHSSKGGMMARLAALGTGSRVVFTPHAIATLDPLLRPLPRLVYGWGELTLALATDAIIAVSADERRHIIGLGVPARKVTLIANAIDPPETGPRQAVRLQLGLAPGDVAIGFVGRLSRQKAIDVMVACFARLARQSGAARLIVIGDGEEAEAARQSAAALGCGDRIVWCGALDARWYYSGFDLLALPSRYEAFSYTTLEAAACGLPIVATDVGGVRDVVTDGVSGSIVPPGDTDAFAAALSRMVLDSDQRVACGTAARARAASSGGRQRMIDQTLALYQELVPRMAGQTR